MNKPLFPWRFILRAQSHGVFPIQGGAVCIAALTLLAGYLAWGGRYGLAKILAAAGILLCLAGLLAIYFMRRAPEPDEELAEDAIPDPVEPAAGETAPSGEPGRWREDTPPMPPNMLIVDDNPANLALIVHFLEDEPVRTRTVADGREAMEKFAAGRYALVLVDVDMRGMAGFETVKAMRRMEGERGQPPARIFAMSGHSFEQSRNACQDADFSGFLEKPLSKKALLNLFGAEPPTPELSSPDRDADADETGDAPVRVAMSLRLRPLAPLFMKTAFDNARKMRKALGANDPETIRRLGHSLKGASRTYGLGDLGERGLALEKAAADADAARLKELLDELDDYLRRMRVVFVEEKHEEPEVR